MAGEVAPDLAALQAALAQASNDQGNQVLSSVVQQPSARPAVESEPTVVYANPQTVKARGFKQSAPWAVASPETPDPQAVQNAVQQSPQNTAQQDQQQTVNQLVQQPTPQPALKQSAWGSPGTPGIIRLIAGMISPSTQEQTGMMRPPSRLDMFERFLGNFVGALGAGMANQGTGPASFSRGFGGAMQYPVQRAYQQQQLEQQQAQTQAEQARTQQTEAQTRMLQSSVPVTLPNGQQVLIPANQIGQYLKGGYASQVSAAAKLSVAQLEAISKAGQVARVEDYRDPQSGQVGRMAYDRQGNPIGLLPGAYSPNQLPTVNTSQQWLQTSPGKWELVSKTSTSGKVLPMPSAASQSAPRSGFPGGPRTENAAATAPPAKSAAVSAPSRRTILSDSTPIFAFDPKANERVLTTPAEAQQKGYTNPIQVHEGDIDKYRAAQVQFNDVQANVSRYRSAAQRFANEGSGSDAVNLNVILNQAKLGGGIHLGPAGIEIPGYSSVAEAADRVARSAAYKGLSPAGKDLVDGYFRTMAAVPAYQKALTAIGRTNKEMLELELANIPNPTMAPADILRKLQAFQENIDQGTSGIPRLPGIPTTRDVRQKFESQPQQQPAPAGKYSSMFFQ